MNPSPPDGGDARADDALEARGETVRARFEARHDAREIGLTASREAIRAAASAIRAIHRDELDRAHELLATAHARLDAAVEACSPHPSVLHAGFVTDAAKEVAEAALTRAAVAGRPLPPPDELGVDDVAWVHGLAETVGELRRASLDAVRGGHLDVAERYLALMQEILAVLTTIDVPDGLTRGLRRATDSARSITERTRGDLTAAAGQHELRDALDAHRQALERSADREV
ncbi:MAG: haloacid dehalogenase [Nitriliruptoraceae bacterium]